MSDLLIRDIPDNVVAGIDAKAKRLGLSRTAYLRRALAREALVAGQPVTAADLSRFTESFADLCDAQVMRRAWS